MGLQLGAVLQAVRVAPWSTGTKTAVTNASTAAIDLTAAKGTGILMSSDIPIHVVFGGSAVADATTNDLMVPANTLIRVDIPSSSSDFAYMKAIREGSTNGSLWYAFLQE